MSAFGELIWKPFLECIEQYGNRDAFDIEYEKKSYRQLAETTSGIRNLIAERPENTIGLVANNDLETYAAIFAIWLEGKAYVPLDPKSPADRNQNIIDQSGIHIILDSSEQFVFPDLHSIAISGITATSLHLTPAPVADTDLAYILFTSGTTGTPKGVPLTRSNVAAFIDAFWDTGIQINPGDKCLQMFQLTFDLSVMSYLAPLLKGGCVHTIPERKMNYMYIFELLEQNNLNVALMVPSVISYLRPYFDEIHCTSLAYCLFCGEALPEEVTNEWSKAAPEAQIYNVYGPTECTIFCSTYHFQREVENKAHNGILSIGKPMKRTEMIVVNERNELLPQGETGELCLGGLQLTPGYWKNEELNQHAFFDLEYRNALQRFYATGDLAYVDRDGDLMFVGRKDSQVHIHGFRIELSEIEFHFKKLLTDKNVVALASTTSAGISVLVLAIESSPLNTKSLLTDIKQHLPEYMIPTKVKYIEEFPLNANGKTDKKKILNLFQ